MAGLTIRRRLALFLERFKPLAPAATAQEQPTPADIKLQLAIWKELSGKWKDHRSKEDQIAEIYRDRTPGRDFSL